MCSCGVFDVGVDERPEVGEGGLGADDFFVGGDEVAEVPHGVAKFLGEAFFVGEVAVAFIPGLPEGLGGPAAEFFFEDAFGGVGPVGQVGFKEAMWLMS